MRYLRFGVVVFCCALLPGCARSVYRPEVSDAGTPEDPTFQGGAGTSAASGGNAAENDEQGTTGGNGGAAGGSDSAGTNAGSDGAAAAGAGGSIPDAGPLACESDNQCTGLGLLCDKERGVCVQCLDDPDCQPGYACSDGQCVDSGGGGGGGFDAGMDGGARCGNGLVDSETYEHCDGDNLGGESCASLGYGGGQLLCTNDCTFDVSMCTFVPDSGYGR